MKILNYLLVYIYNLILVVISFFFLIMNGYTWWPIFLIPLIFGFRIRYCDDCFKKMDKNEKTID